MGDDVCSASAKSCSFGEIVGCFDGLFDGSLVGGSVSSFVGWLDGLADGDRVGFAEGEAVGPVVGIRDGVSVGNLEGCRTHDNMKLCQLYSDAKHNKVHCVQSRWSELTC